MFLNCEVVSEPEILNISNTLQSIITPQNLLSFLIINKYVGYLNFELIKVFQKVLKSVQLGKEIEEYEKNYIAFLKLFDFNAILDAFKQHPSLAPGSIIGLPKFKFRLQRPWLGRCVFTWAEVFHMLSMSTRPPSSLIDSIEQSSKVSLHDIPYITNT